MDAQPPPHAATFHAGLQFSIDHVPQQRSARRGRGRKPSRKPSRRPSPSPVPTLPQPTSTTTLPAPATAMPDSLPSHPPQHADGKRKNKDHGEAPPAKRHRQGAWMPALGLVPEEEEWQEALEEQEWQEAQEEQERQDEQGGGEGSRSADSPRPLLPQPEVPSSLPSSFLLVPSSATAPVPLQWLLSSFASQPLRPAPADSSSGRGTGSGSGALGPSPAAPGAWSPLDQPFTRHHDHAESVPGPAAINGKAKGARGTNSSSSRFGSNANTHIHSVSCGSGLRPPQPTSTSTYPRLKTPKTKPAKPSGPTSRDRSPTRSSSSSSLCSWGGAAGPAAAPSSSSSSSSPSSSARPSAPLTTDRAAAHLVAAAVAQVSCTQAVRYVDLENALFDECVVQKTRPGAPRRVSRVCSLLSRGRYMAAKWVGGCAVNVEQLRQAMQGAGGPGGREAIVRALGEGEHLTRDLAGAAVAVGAVVASADLGGRKGKSKGQSEGQSTGAGQHKDALTVVEASLAPPLYWDVLQTSPVDGNGVAKFTVLLVSEWGERGTVEDRMVRLERRARWAGRVDWEGVWAEQVGLALLLVTLAKARSVWSDFKAANALSNTNSASGSALAIDMDGIQRLTPQQEAEAEAAAAASLPAGASKAERDAALVRQLALLACVCRWYTPHVAAPEQTARPGAYSCLASQVFAYGRELLRHVWWLQQALQKAGVALSQEDLYRLTLLRALAERCCAPLPEDRPTAGEVLACLRAGAEGQGQGPEVVPQQGPIHPQSGPGPSGMDGSEEEAQPGLGSGSGSGSVHGPEQGPDALAAGHVAMEVEVEVEAHGEDYGHLLPLPAGQEFVDVWGLPLELQQLPSWPEGVPLPPPPPPPPPFGLQEQGQEPMEPLLLPCLAEVPPPPPPPPPPPLFLQQLEQGQGQAQAQLQPLGAWWVVQNAAVWQQLPLQQPVCDGSWGAEEEEEENATRLEAMEAEGGAGPWGMEAEGAGHGGMEVEAALFQIEILL